MLCTHVLLIFCFTMLLASTKYAVSAGEYSNGLDSGVKFDQDHTRRSRNIHVAVTIDRNSMGDFLLAVHSAVNAAQNPSKVVIHVVACGVDINDARDIATQAESALINCLPHTRRIVLPWVLPASSGFRLQMSGQNSRLKDKKHHWTSPAGADMARFFLPSLFPDAPRLLYFDNDAIISCCLDEIYDTDFSNPNAIVGVALDDLKWATATQFQRHYNSTHPLVIQNLRRRGFSAVFASKEAAVIEKQISERMNTPSSSKSGESYSGVGGKNEESRRHIRKGKRAAGVGTSAGGGGRVHGIHKLTADPIGGLGAPGEVTVSETSKLRRRYLATAAGAVDPKELSVEEFVTALPRYPNDGVILFHVPRYNIANILHIVDEIARANAQNGDYVVNLGTQQFTVLALWDRWTELTPRANLRHFPDMARGYLMWFLYNGLIHYAGAAKPASICHGEGGMELRRMTYTPWATAVAQLTGHSRGSSSISTHGNNTFEHILSYKNSCSVPEKLISSVAQCARHIPTAPTLREFFELVSIASQSSQLADDGLLYLRIGSPVANLDQIKISPVSGAQGVRSANLTTAGTFDARSRSHDASRGPGPEVDGIAYFDALLLNQVSWSWRVYDNDHSIGVVSPIVPLQGTPSQREKKRLDQSRVSLEKSFKAGQAALKAAYENPSAVQERERKREIRQQKHNEEHAGNKKAPKLPPLPSYYERRHMVMTTDANICDGRVSHTHYVDKVNGQKLPFGFYPVIDHAGNIDPTSRTAMACQSVLAHLKQEKPKGKAHWDVVAITVDIDLTELQGQSSLQALLALNLDFMRPKFILARIPVDVGWELGAPEGGKKEAFVGTGRTVPVDRYNVGKIPKSNYNDYSVYGGDVGSDAISGHTPLAAGILTGVSEANDAGVGTSVHQALRFLTKHGYMAYSDESGQCAHGAGSTDGQQPSKEKVRYVCVWGTLLNTLEIDGL